MTYLTGTTSLGTEISINRSFLDADLRITTGDVEYHQFCGYGGGVKCVYPGLADAAAIRANHSRMDLPGTGPGSVDGNPVRREIDEVGRMARVNFNISIAMDAEHRIVAVRAGDPDLSFRQACRFIDKMYAVEVPRRADIRRTSICTSRRRPSKRRPGSLSREETCWSRPAARKVIDSARLPDLPPTGPVGLQHHGDPVQFRKMFIKPLDL